MDESEKIVLGSGKCYVVEFSGSVPDIATIENDANLIGLIQGGATLQYKPEYKTVTDDLERVQKTVLTHEEVSLKTGVMTWCGNTLTKVCATARVTEDGTTRTVKIGGLKNSNGKQYVIHFLHEDPTDGNIRITIVGQNQSGFSLAFVKDKETVVDAEFKAAPNDSEGTLVIYREDILGGGVKASGLFVSSAAGSTSGTTLLTVTPVLSGGDSYRYLRGASIPDVGDVLSAWTAWDGTSDITAATGDIITVAEVDGDLKAVKAGVVTVTAMV